MTIHSPQKKSQKKKTLLRQLGNLLTGDRTPATPAPDTRNQPTTIETSVVLPFSPPPVFIDYAAEGDEPADLALIELIPTGLKALNLPFIPTTKEENPADLSVANTVENSYQPTDCPTPTETEAMNQAVAAAELSELTPIELTSLNIAPRKSAPRKSAPRKSLQLSDRKALTARTENIAEQNISEQIAETVWEDVLEQNKTNQGTDYQGASQPEESGDIKTSQSPLPDLSTLKKACREKARREKAYRDRKPTESSIETVRVPTAYLHQLEQIVEGLLHQQNQQSRHNEQLGALVKQLLSRVAQQQTELSRLGKGDYSDVQQMIQTCLTNY